VGTDQYQEGPFGTFRGGTVPCYVDVWIDDEPQVYRAVIGEPYLTVVFGLLEV